MDMMEVRRAGFVSVEVKLSDLDNALSSSLGLRLAVKLLSTVQLQVQILS